MHAIQSLLHKRGIDSAALLSEVGLDAAAMSDPMARFPVDKGMAFLELAIDRTGDELLGVHLALDMPQMQFNSLSYALMASENLAHMYANLARYAHVVTQAGGMSFEVKQGVGRLAFNNDMALESHYTPQTGWAWMDYAMVSSLRGSRAMFGGDFVPLEVRMQRSRPKDHETFERILRCVPVYGCEDNAILVDEAALGRKSPFANAVVAKASQQSLDVYQASQQASAQALDARISVVLSDLLPAGEPAKAGVAQRLGLTLSAFQRQLSQQQIAYRDVLNDTRHKLALDHLSNQQYSVGDVAFLLGFAEISAFTRAFRRWTGQSPSAWRGGAGRPATQINPASSSAVH